VYKYKVGTILKSTGWSRKTAQSFALGKFWNVRRTGIMLF